MRLLARSLMLVLLVLCLPELRGLISGLYFLTFKYREVRNSTVSQNMILILLESWNAVCVSFLVFFVIPYLTMFQALMIPYLCLTGPLFIPIIYKASISPKGNKGMLLDLVGLTFVLGGIALAGLEYFYILDVPFHVENNFWYIVTSGSLLFCCFNVLNNYQKCEKAKGEEGFYWVHFLSPIVRTVVFVSAYFLCLFYLTTDSPVITELLSGRLIWNNDSDNSNATICSNVTSDSNATLCYNKTIIMDTTNYVDKVLGMAKVCHLPWCNWG